MNQLQAGLAAMSNFSAMSRMNPNPPATHVQGTLPATNAWTTRQSVFASEPNPMTPGIVLPAQTRLYVANTTQTHGFIQAYWPGRGWNFVPFSDVMMESDYVRVATPSPSFRPSATITLDGLPNGPNAWSTGEKVAAAAGGALVVGGLLYLVTRKKRRR
jgi:hypothetical protein